MEKNKTDLDDEDYDMESNFQKAFGWYVVTNRIAANDFTKHEHIYEKTINEILNQLSYLISYDNEQIRLQKKAEQRR